MSWLLLAVLAATWAAVLPPVWGGAKQRLSDRLSIGTYARSMRALRSNHELAGRGGRWVLTPGRPLEGTRRRRSILVRRRIFCCLLAAVALTSLASVVPGLRHLLWVSASLAVVLGAFIAFLLSEKRKTARPQTAPSQFPKQRSVEDGRLTA